MQIHTLLYNLLDYIFPREELTKELEMMDVTTIFQKTKPCTDSYKTIFTPFEYRSPLIRRAIWEIKYANNKKILHLMAEALNQYLLQILEDELLFSDRDEVLVIPIPSSSKRKRERGYNQTELLAREMENLLPKLFRVHTHILYKQHHTLPQTKTLSRSERLHNICGSFSVQNPFLVKNKTVILLDDVITTGATMKEAAGALAGLGARRIYCVAIAH